VSGSRFSQVPKNKAFDGEGCQKTPSSPGVCCTGNSSGPDLLKRKPEAVSPGVGRKELSDRGGLGGREDAENGATGQRLP